MAVRTNEKKPTLVGGDPAARPPAGRACGKGLTWRVWGVTMRALRRGFEVDRQQLQASLQTLKASPLVRVAFVLDNAGVLAAWAGKAPGFSPVGQFPTERTGEEPLNLYLTAVGPYFVGVLFPDGDDVDAVRDVMEAEHSRLVSSLGIIEEGSA